MGNAECSVENSSNCMKERDDSPFGKKIPGSPQSPDKYFAAQEEGFTTASEAQKDGNNVNSSMMTWDSGSPSAVGMLRLEDQNGSAPLRKYCRCSNQFLGESVYCRRCGGERESDDDRDDRRSDLVLPPAPGEDEVGGGSTSSTCMSPGGGPGQSASRKRPDLEDVRIGFPRETIADPPEPSRQHCYFDFDIGECPDTAESSTKERHKLKFRSGAEYDGYWHNGVREGVGQQKWLDGTYYIGSWIHGRAGGHGMIRHSDGDAYVGEWLNGRAHGHGIYRFHGGHAVYEGEFRCDLRDGVGVENWVDGSWYAGDFKKGAKHGVGVHTWPDSTHYVGYWRNNELHGWGNYAVASDGPFYKGKWQKSAIHGFGIYIWPDGERYDGYYENDKKHGFGVLSDMNGILTKQGFWSSGEWVKGFVP